VTGDGTQRWAAFEACVSGNFTCSSLQLAEDRLLRGLLRYKLFITLFKACIDI